MLAWPIDLQARKQYRADSHRFRQWPGRHPCCHSPQTGPRPGSKLDFVLEGDSIRVRPLKSIPPSRLEEGYGMLRCELPGQRRLADFDVAEVMRIPPER